MISFTTHGYMGDGSPDRTDALIWGLSELFPCIISSGSGGGFKSVKPPSDLPDSYMGSAVANATTGWVRYKAKVTNRGSGGSQRPRARPQERGLWAANRDWK